MVGLIINWRPEHALIAEAFSRGIGNHGGSCNQQEWPLNSNCAPPIPRHDGSVKILLCTNNGDTAIDRAVDALLKAVVGAEITVCAHGEHDSGWLAMHCLNQGARDFFNSSSMPRTLAIRSVEYALKGRAPYPKFNVEIVPGSRVFVSTPYPEAEADISAIEEAINFAGYTPHVSRETHPPAELYTKVTNEICDSQLVVANCTAYSRSDHNANVFLEVGFALAKGIPVIFFRRVGSPPLPSLVRGKMCPEYYTPADLAVQLYYGLKRIS